jgi:predicted O-methyltransferase YrrM
VATAVRGKRGEDNGEPRKSGPGLSGIGNHGWMAVGGSSAYAGLEGLPGLVKDALALASAQEFDHSCAPEQGRLLSVLAKGRSGGRVGETGTGCGVGLAWMVGAADAATTFVSVELDAARATGSAELFARHPNVVVLNGDWRELRSHGPFDLLVLDGGGKGKEPQDDPPLDPVDGWLAPGGSIVLDDFTPAGEPGAPLHDPARRYWLEHPALRTTEIRLSSTLATLVGTRVG